VESDGSRQGETGMKCIHCGSDTTYKVRQSNGGRCGSCLHPFAFEPKTDPYTVSDTLFQRIIKDVSSDGKLSFTEKQLCYELNRRLVGKMPYMPVPFRWGMAACGVGTVASIFIFPPLAIAGVIGAIATGVIGAKVGKNHPDKRFLKVPYEQFRTRYLKRWMEVHGQIDKLTMPVPRRPSIAVSSMPPDLTLYSFDRVLITQDADTAAMLVANRFHFENNCAILSYDRRYPQNGLFDTILEMLRRNPRLLVFTIHDASPDGLEMANQLHTPTWFPELRTRIFDLGLRPAHAIKGNLILNRGTPWTPPATTMTGLTPEEVKWLATGAMAELAAVRPARLMRAVYQGFSRANEMTQYDDDGGVIFLDTGPGVYAYGYDGTHAPAGGEMYASDSFG
jgi:hypothetical protein